MTQLTALNELAKLNEPAKPAKLKRGGARPNAGRAKMPSGLTAQRKNISIDPEDAELLTSLGGGSLSLGIRQAAQIVRSQSATGIKADWLIP